MAKNERNCIFTGQNPEFFYFHENCLQMKKSYVPSYWVFGFKKIWT